MGVILPIPYKSQEDSDANRSRNDCGPTSLAMILNGFDVNVTTNAVHIRTGANTTEFVSIYQLMRASESYGITFTYFSGAGRQYLFDMLDQGRPIIALIHYGYFVSVDYGVSTQSFFTGPHFLVVSGYDDKYVYVHDPLWWGSRRDEGKYKRWTHDQFFTAWNQNSKDGNRNASGIYCNQKFDAIKVDGIWQSTNVPTMDPLDKRKITAWCHYHNREVPNLTSTTVVASYLEAMDGWGDVYVEHTVQAGDTMSMIALYYYDDPLKWDVIRAYNGLALSDVVSDGTVLLIPEPLRIPIEFLPEDERPIGGSSPYLDLTPADPNDIRKIAAWAAYIGIAQPTVPNNQVAQTYLQAMGEWGTIVIDHTVSQTDDLGLIALKYYDDPLKWEVIKYYNNLPPVNAFSPGDVLEIINPIQNYT